MPEQIARPATRMACTVASVDHFPVRSGSSASCRLSTPTARTRSASSVGEPARRDQEHTPTRRPLAPIVARESHAPRVAPSPADLSPVGYHGRVGDLPPDLEKIFAELTEQVGGIRPEVLPEAYLRALQEIEDLPCNRPGQDKSWVVRAVRHWREVIRSARLLS